MMENRPRRAGVVRRIVRAKGVLSLREEGLSYRLIARNVGLSKNTMMGNGDVSTGEALAHDA